MPLPPKPFYGVPELAIRWSVHPFDIVGWAMQGLLVLSAALPLVETEAGALGPRARAAGLVEIAGEDVIGLFRRDGVPWPSAPIRRFRRASGGEWEWIASPAEGTTLTAADLLIASAEAERFEQRWGIFGPATASSPAPVLKRPAGPGSPPRYDWDAFYAALARRVHDNGIPATQGELVREMLDWFSQREEMHPPDESTVRRRASVVWRELTRPEAR